MLIGGSGLTMCETVFIACHVGAFKNAFGLFPCNEFVIGCSEMWLFKQYKILNCTLQGKISEATFYPCQCAVLVMLL